MHFSGYRAATFISPAKQDPSLSDYNIFLVSATSSIGGYYVDVRLASLDCSFSLTSSDHLHVRDAGRRVCDSVFQGQDVRVHHNSSAVVEVSITDLSLIRD